MTPVLVSRAGGGREWGAQPLPVGGGGEGARAGASAVPGERHLWLSHLGPSITQPRRLTHYLPFPAHRRELAVQVSRDLLPALRARGVKLYFVSIGKPDRGVLFSERTGAAGAPGML